MSLPELATNTNLCKPTIPDVHPRAQSRKIRWYDLSANEKTLKSTMNRKKGQLILMPHNRWQ